jgi:hypothetical protein
VHLRLRRKVFNTERMNQVVFSLVVGSMPGRFAAPLRPADAPAVLLLDREAQ